MANPKPRSLLLTAAVTAALAVAGCGGSSSSSTDAAVVGASAAFLKPHSQTNKYVNYGEESSAAERKAASPVLSSNLKSREEADFAVQCSTLSRKMIDTLLKTEAGSKSCPDALKALAEPLVGTKSVRTDKLKGPIGALRVKGDSAYALFHGTDHADYAMLMANESGTWKVAEIKTIELDPPKVVREALNKREAEVQKP